MMRQMRNILIGLFCLAAIVTGCQANETSSGQPNQAASSASSASGKGAETSLLRIGWQDGGFPSPFAFSASGPGGFLRNSFLFDTLTWKDEQGVIPWLAKSWEVSDDGLVYTFELEQGVKWHDGQDFTADDVVFSINRVKTDWKISLKSAMDVVANVEKKDDLTVVVTLSKPSNSWLYRMTTRIGAMFSRDGVSDLANTPVGTGPYKLESWRRGDSITFVRNENYWGTKPALSSMSC